MLDEATRQRIMLHQEGAVLSNVGQCGAADACEVACCQIDGIANALIRMQGAKHTAYFVFALSDRVAGGVRDVTDYCPPFPAPEQEIVEATVAPEKQNRVPDFAYGFLSGLAAMLTVTILAMGKF